MDKKEDFCQGKAYPIMGCPVLFPESKKPFPAQFAVMNKIIQALNQSKHALLESPTGSGKTLALLCSSLSWQIKEIEERLAEADQKENIRIEKTEEKDDELTKKRSLPDWFTKTDDPKHKFQKMGADGSPVNGNNDDATPKLKFPRIFFASRTHSQLAQVIGEFRRCPRAFVDVSARVGLKMTILGSRKHMCVNSLALNSDSVDDFCIDASRTDTCKWKRGDQAFQSRTPLVWDIEDLVELGKEHEGCPYYHSKESAKEANIIFCPYNYLLNPSIRASMDIKLNEAIIVLDEAHNIEDVCRDASSMELTLGQINDSIDAFSEVLEYGVLQDYVTIRNLMKGLAAFMTFATNQVKPIDFEKNGATWNGTQAMGFLNEYMSVTHTSFPTFLKAWQAVKEHEKEMASNQHAKRAPLGSTVLNPVNDLINTFGYMLGGKLEHVEDYRLIVFQSKNTFGRSTNVPKWVAKVCLWSLNPSVAFKEVASVARSIILTSGTLSPMDSFSGELGIDFPIRLEANHVINTKKQLWIGAVEYGPNRVDLCATYKNQQTLHYQDALGEAIAQYCSVIPGGVLVFLPSYFLMDKLLDRWETVGILDKFKQFKQVFQEPRRVGAEFDECISQYRQCIDIFTKDPTQSNGGLLFAVYRGKISEGIDFADDYARGALIIGIPYPNSKDLKVSLKKTYQDIQPKSRNLLRSSLWYSNLAFRALNQALGRCIRHRNDYGAIVLLDPRYGRLETQKQLSKWARNHVQNFRATDDTICSLQHFFQSLTVTD